ncbi:hypothetical protein BJF93_04625 [Xaviernesmea oryzae]|uniref:Uncharacterized protein n=1 Tax=Xaviernesmea oryzae TaxID=464029 RepID=A0A1Q9AUT2_9HYPH|nr:hypothetical protein [Xaviernesmea oryzae]OLP59189.1 hypothetical protein BJF93_04625 [Xaviernesmea oryzae]SEK82406.1 hypothetical protein SAMN04487976_104116 [Xaviernesmea oryzae]
MNQAHDDLTLEEVLTDPMIRMMMRADGVTTSEMKTLLYSAASAMRGAENHEGGARAAAHRLMTAPKRRLLAMVHPLAMRGEMCMAC